MMGNKSRKARGLYSDLSEADQDLYDLLMKKTFIESLKKFTRKELAYLSNLYEDKVNQIRDRLQNEDLNYDIENKDVLAIVLAIKIKALIARKKINVLRLTKGKYKLDYKKKSTSRNKLKKVVKANQ